MPRPTLARTLPLALAGLSCAALVGVVALVRPDAAAPPGGSGSSTSGGSGTSLGRISTVAFRSFDDCADLLAYYRSHAAKRVGPYGLPGIGGGREIMVAEGAATADARAAAPAAQAADATGTNVQVAGVDEADMVKVDGDLLVTVADGRLQVLRIGAGRAEPLGSLRLPEGQLLSQPQLLLHGSTVLVLASTPGGVVPLAERPVDGVAARPGLVPLRAGSRITQVDLADPSEPRIVRSLEVDGELVGARLADGTARLAISSSPTRLRWKLPNDPNNLGGATTANRKLARSADLGQWLPRFTLREHAADGTVASTRRGQLLECTNVAAPRRFSGLDTLSMLSLDLRAGGPGVARWSGAGVVATGSTLYATADRAYVTTQPWADAMVQDMRAIQPVPRQPRTQVHLFDTPPAAPGSRSAAPPVPAYLASGEVRGTLLNQFALDEHDGVLRVASTTDQLPGAVAPDTAVSNGDGSQSRVTTLRRDGDRLVQVGVVSGLGKGERIRGVRFAGPLGYVVTFRQTDPLYTVDLSDPARPRVAGELKVLGYSAYLHPLDDGLLLGIGQDGNAQGQLSGMQMSLFDVSDPAAPRRLDQVPLPNAWSDVEGDHHAFTMAGGLALAPFQRWTGRDVSTAAIPAEEFDTGVMAVGVSDRRLARPHVLRPLADGPSVVGQAPGDMQVPEVLRSTPQRTVVLDGTVYSVTPVGIAAHDATSFERLGFTRYR